MQRDDTGHYVYTTNTVQLGVGPSAFSVYPKQIPLFVNTSYGTVVGNFILLCKQIEWVLKKPIVSFMYISNAVPSKSKWK